MEPTKRERGNKKYTNTTLSHHKFGAICRSTYSVQIRNNSAVNFDSIHIHRTSTIFTFFLIHHSTITKIV